VQYVEGVEMLKSMIAAVLILSTMAFTWQSQPQEIEVSGRVVDASGKPVGGAEISVYGVLWDVKAQDFKFNEPIKTDVEGRFSKKIKVNMPALSFFAADPTHKQGGFTLVKQENMGAFEIKIEPLRELRFKIETPALEGEPPFIAGIVARKEGGMAWLENIGADNKVMVPAGNYDIMFYSPELKGGQAKADLTAGNADAGTVKMELSVLASLYGKKPPELKVVEGRGVDPKFTLDQYRGKWVILEFWGFW
jgi:hypothetical protein